MRCMMLVGLDYYSLYEDDIAEVNKMYIKKARTENERRPNAVAYDTPQT